MRNTEYHYRIHTIDEARAYVAAKRAEKITHRSRVNAFDFVAHTLSVWATDPKTNDADRAVFVACSNIIRDAAKEDRLAHREANQHAFKRRLIG
ncbi:hypothetical protein BU632_11590, partial [Staphylococcus chromogenes]|uniref:hypothetical protein n=1 Tax=Staphylococcus chromogenes TaxID=46126 RepID=UPI000D44F44E